ncbi:MAG TPA: diguanylate cyclase, partial [Clostridia bacterium]|nr:diguanylate cyclase [Clostridia bacterium]
RFFEQELIQMDVEKNLPLSIIMGDVNGLKLTNDAFGHLAGDSLLKAAASVMRKSCGKDDIVARWGGDEYIILLPNTDNREAGKIAEHIRATCAETTVGNISLSISLGYSTKARAQDDLMEALKRADDSMYKSKLIEGRSMKSGAVNTIINTLHEKNPREKNHSLRVGAICRQIGLAMGFLQSQITDMELLARIHDIGKISIDEKVFEKTGKLTREELEEIHRHPETGYYIIGASPELSYLANDVLSHHERWDSGGYPNHLAGNNIPLLARILSIADAYEAMTGERQYKKAMTKEEAMEELKRCSGSQFDPVITEKFLRVLKDGNCLL